MNTTLKTLGVGFLNLMLCLTLSTVALSLDREVYDKGDTHQAGKTMHGEVVKVDKRDGGTQNWNVSVKHGDTGEVVALHVDKTTTRKDMNMEPSIGDHVIVKYDEKSKHAISFLTDEPISH